MRGKQKGKKGKETRSKGGNGEGSGQGSRRGIPCWSFCGYASWGSRSRVLCCMLVLNLLWLFLAKQATCVRDLVHDRVTVAAACAFTRRAPAADGAGSALRSIWIHSPPLSGSLLCYPIYHHHARGEHKDKMEGQQSRGC